MQYVWNYLNNTGLLQSLINASFPSLLACSSIAKGLMQDQLPLVSHAEGTSCTTMPYSTLLGRQGFLILSLGWSGT
jgi:hypothetical protein